MYWSVNLTRSRSTNKLDRQQAAHKIEHRQHLIEEAKKAYAQKLVADKAGGAKEGELSPVFNSGYIARGVGRRSRTRRSYDWP